jgi:hypothetical protein
MNSSKRSKSKSNTTQERNSLAIEVADTFATENVSEDDDSESFVSFSYTSESSNWTVTSLILLSEYDVNCKENIFTPCFAQTSSDSSENSSYMSYKLQNIDSNELIFDEVVFEKDFTVLTDKIVETNDIVHQDLHIFPTDSKDLVRQVDTIQHESYDGIRVESSRKINLPILHNQQQIMEKLQLEYFILVHSSKYEAFKESNFKHFVSVISSIHHEKLTVLERNEGLPQHLAKKRIKNYEFIDNILEARYSDAFLLGQGNR